MEYNFLTAIKLFKQNRIKKSEKIFFDFYIRSNFFLGNIKLKRNDIDGSMNHYHLILKENKNFNELYFKNFNLFCRNRITKNNYNLMKEICEFYFKDDLVYHNYGFENALKFTKFFDYKVSKKSLTTDNRSMFNKKSLEVFDDKVLNLILKKSLVRNVLLESYLTKIRKNLLRNFSNKKKKNFLRIFSFLISFAEQCYFNEFIYFFSSQEEKWIKSLEIKIKKEEKICEISILLLALYKPLSKLLFLKEKLDKYVSASREFNDFLKFTFFNPRKEKMILKKIQSISKITDKTSKIIKKQYEENPYPRWRHTSRPIKININLISKKSLKNKNINLKKPLILIAGCGTGLQVVQYSGIKNAKIVAVDISKESLAYAKRKTDEMNIDNVEYVHLDLLNLNLLRQKFDLIVCSGCLHHMEDPKKGLDSLLSVLKDNGLIFLGLYSSKARVSIKQMRDFIEKKKLDATYEKMISIRQKITNSKNKKIQNIKKSIDFFSMSRFRDLIFNYKEHTFDLIQIKKIIKKKKLNFLGFDRLNSLIIKKFLEINPKKGSEFNLDLWDKFELVYPRTFSGMYNFWIEKK